MRMSPLFLAGAMSLSLTGGVAAAQQKLSEVSYVTEGLIAVGIAYEISEVCDDLSARTIRGITYLNQLRSYAREQGFSNDEIKEYTDNDAEQDKLEAIARARLEAMGATPKDVASHCAVGRSEIAKGSTIGYLLRD